LDKLKIEKQKERNHFWISNQALSAETLIELKTYNYTHIWSDRIMSAVDQNGKVSEVMFIPMEEDYFSKLPQSEKGRYYSIVLSLHNVQCLNKLLTQYQNEELDLLRFIDDIIKELRVTNILHLQTLGKMTNREKEPLKPTGILEFPKSWS